MRAGRKHSTAKVDPSQIHLLKMRSSVDRSRILYTTRQPPDTIIIFSLSTLVAAPSSVSDDQLLDSLLSRSEPWVGEEGKAGYTMVLLAAQGSVKGRGMPSWRVAIARWRQIPRR